ncbi:MAG: DNA recombination protein RmuC, partial [Planctomycetota bacterium]
ENAAARAREAASEEKSALLADKARLEERLAKASVAEDEFRDAFAQLSREALEQNSEAFLKLANVRMDQARETAGADLEAKGKAIEALLTPVKESIQRVDQTIKDVETKRSQAHGAMWQQVQSLQLLQGELRSETSRLVDALKKPHTRGRWGEIQLKRVVEMAGMLDHCDFYEQETTEDSEGAKMRPDVVVRLPGGKSVVIDAKTPLKAFIDALEAEDGDGRTACMVAHARNVRNHMTDLGRKSYWANMKSSPEFVVMFLPGENFFSAALEQDPSLIEFGVEKKVIPATPTTLIALLKTVAYSWKQEQLAENAEKIKELGGELHERLSVFATHFGAAGRALNKAGEMYNKALASMESRLVVTARKFKDLGAGSSEEIPDPTPVEQSPRAPSLPLRDDVPA